MYPRWQSIKAIVGESQRRGAKMLSRRKNLNGILKNKINRKFGRECQGPKRFSQPPRRGYEKLFPFHFHNFAIWQVSHAFAIMWGFFISFEFGSIRDRSCKRFFYCSCFACCTFMRNRISKAINSAALPQSCGSNKNSDKRNTKSTWKLRKKTLLICGHRIFWFPFLYSLSKALREI